MEAKTVSVSESLPFRKLRELQDVYMNQYNVDAEYALTLIRKDCLELKALQRAGIR